MKQILPYLCIILTELNELLNLKVKLQGKMAAVALLCMIFAMIALTGDALRTRSLVQPQSMGALSMGIFDMFNKITTTRDSAPVDAARELKSIQKLVNEINAKEEQFEALSDSDLQQRALNCKNLVRKGSSLEDVLVDAFALVREASWRVLALRHFDVQLMGGIALHRGFLAEMATGEGKTLVAILPAFLHALSEESTFVVTSNDYLARRDAESVGQVLRFLGLSVGVIQQDQNEQQRRTEYSADVTYVSNQALGFDYLRDNLALAIDNLVMQRPLGFCIVDEADSVLIDEARTPLLISRKGNAAPSKYVTANKIVASLQLQEHYSVDVKNQRVELTSAGYSFCEMVLGKSLFDIKDPWAIYLLNALRAKELLKRDQQYIVSDGEISIVDAFSGRVLVGRRFADGVQQAVEAKEGLAISAESQTTAKVSFQSLFRLFPRLTGMSGTAATDAEELRETYGLEVLTIPTALPVARRDYPDAIFRTKTGKMKALLRNVLSTHEKGRPVLIGTTSVESSEEIAGALQDIGLNANVLNARPENLARENEIVAQAGRLGAITVATNMAGRGTDIALGGNAKGILRTLLRSLLCARLNIKHHNACADTAAALVYDASSDNNQLEEALSKLQRDLNVALPHFSLSLLRELLSAIRNFSPSPLPNNVGEVEETVAKVVEGSSADSIPLQRLREALTPLRDELEAKIEEEGQTVRRLGGLYVIGTARHESRRIDNQLRGRAGRQGDPGSSRFFLSLEDDLFRVFGGDQLRGVLENFRVPEDMPIESEMVAQALDKVQRTVEEYYTSMRRRVREIDEVSAAQREQVYSIRREVLISSDEELYTRLVALAEDTLKEIMAASGWKNTEKLVSKVKQFFPNIDIAESQLRSLTVEGEVYKLLSRSLSEALEKKLVEIEETSAYSRSSFFRFLYLVQADKAWTMHLTRLDMLQEELVLQSFRGDRDELSYYKDSAQQLFDGLLEDVRRNTVYSIFVYQPKKTS